MTIKYKYFAMAKYKETRLCVSLILVIKKHRDEWEWGPFKLLIANTGGNQDINNIAHKMPSVHS